MKTLIVLAAFFLPFGSVAKASECSQKEELKKLKKSFRSYQPARPVQVGATGSQSSDMGAHSSNASAGGNAAGACAAKFTEFEGKFKKLKDKLSDPSCEEEKNEAEKLERSANAKGAECAAAGGAMNKQEEKSSDNEKKMGEEKKGGDSGKPPEMPQIPPKKEEKKEDLAAKERERQAKIAECKARVNNALEIKKRNCEVEFNFNPTYPVAGMKQKQDECKQASIFESQAEVAECE